MARFKRSSGVSTDVLAKSSEMFARGHRFAQHSLNAWAGYYAGIHSATHALVSVKGYGAFHFAGDSFTAMGSAYCSIFEAYASLFGCGSNPSGTLDFDSEAQMAGPLFVDLVQPASCPAVPSDLVFVGQGPSFNAAPAIPRGNVVARIGGVNLTTLAVTLVNLSTVTPTLVPGAYKGTVTIGTTVVTVTATFRVACSDEPDAAPQATTCPLCALSRALCRCCP
jgi:hypothetical protein